MNTTITKLTPADLTECQDELVRVLVAYDEGHTHDAAHLFVGAMPIRIRFAQQFLRTGQFAPDAFFQVLAEETGTDYPLSLKKQAEMMHEIVRDGCYLFGEIGGEEVIQWDELYLMLQSMEGLADEDYDRVPADQWRRPELPVITEAVS